MFFRASYSFLVRCEDGPEYVDVMNGTLAVDVADETGCTNLEVLPGMPLCSGECVADTCPEPQCLYTNVNDLQPFRQFTFQCDSKYNRGVCHHKYN